jgi:hypothetical protein
MAIERQVGFIVGVLVVAVVGERLTLQEVKEPGRKGTLMY